MFTLSPATNTIGTEDVNAIPATVPLIAAFTYGAGCVALTTDTNDEDDQDEDRSKGVDKNEVDDDD